MLNSLASPLQFSNHLILEIAPFSVLVNGSIRTWDNFNRTSVGSGPLFTNSIL